MLLINATVSKNQLYKPKNQINEVPTIIKQDDIFFSKYFCTSFYNFLLKSAIYVRVITMVGF